MSYPERSKSTLFCCSALHVIHDGISNMLYVLLPILAQQFGLNLTQVGILRGVHSAAMALFQVPFGVLAEKMGERKLLTVGTIVAGISIALLAVSADFSTLFVLLAICGVAQAVQHPLCSSLVSRAFLFGKHRAAMGTYNFAGDLGKFAIAGLVSLAIASGLDWTASTTIIGSGTILVGIVVGWALYKYRLGDSIATKKGDSNSSEISNSWGIENWPAFYALCTIGILDNSVRAGILTFIAFLMTAKGVSYEWAVLAVTMIIAGGMFGKLACGFIADRFGVIRTVLATEIATFIGVILVIILPNYFAFALLPLLGIVLNGTSSVLYGSVGDLVNEQRQARAFGLFYTLSSAAGVAAPLGFGFIGDVIGIENSLIIAACLALCTIPLTRSLRSSAVAD